MTDGFSDEPPITRTTCEQCGLNGDPNGPKAAQAYAHQGLMNQDKADRFKRFVSRHPYLRRCRGCKVVHCTRFGCKCDC